MEDLPVMDGLVIPGAELSWTSVTASGPGGQNVNKVATKVVLRFNPYASEVLAAEVRTRLRELASRFMDSRGVIRVSSQATRSQAQNLEIARDTLARLLRMAHHQPKRRRPTRTPRRAVEARLAAKRRRSQTKRGRTGESKAQE